MVKPQQIQKFQSCILEEQKIVPETDDHAMLSLTQEISMTASDKSMGV